MTLTASARRVSGAGDSPGGGARRRPRATDGWWPWLFIGPTLAGILIFYVWPIAQTAYFSFTKWGVFGGTTWVGVENYTRLATDSHAWSAVANTLIYTGIVLLGVPLAILFASMINRPGLRGATIYRVLFFMPYVALPTAIAMVWRLIYNGDFGILNWFISLFGVEKQYWLTTPGLALVSVGVVGMWSSMGFNMIILSAGLKGIPAELYEAASLDGAGRVRQFFTVTVPLLTPSIFFVTVITVIHGFQLFDLLFAIMGRNNPVLRDTQSMVYLFYSEAFLNNDKGYGAAIAMLILLLVGLCTVLQFSMQKRWVNYV